MGPEMAYRETPEGMALRTAKFYNVMSKSKAFLDPLLTQWFDKCYAFMKEVSICINEGSTTEMLHDKLYSVHNGC